MARGPCVQMLTISIARACEQCAGRGRHCLLVGLRRLIEQRKVRGEAERGGRRVQCVEMRGA